MRKCGICKHALRAEIDAALSVNHVIAQVARTFGLKESPLRRHRDAGHHNGEASATTSDPPEELPTTSPEQVVADPPLSTPMPADASPQAPEPPPSRSEREPDSIPFASPQEAPIYSPPPIARPSPVPAFASSPKASWELPAGARSMLTIDAALARAQASVDAVRLKERVVTIDGREYRTSRTTDIVRVARAALLAEGLALSQVRQRVRAIGSVPCLVVLYALRYVITNPAEIEYIETEIPFPTDRSDLHFKAGATSTYALRYTLKRLLLIDEEEDDKVDLEPSIPASEPDPWGLAPDRPITREETALYAQRHKELLASMPALPLDPNADKIVAKARTEARGREFARRAVLKRQGQTGQAAPPSSPSFHGADQGAEDEDFGKE